MGRLGGGSRRLHQMGATYVSILIRMVIFYSETNSRNSSKNINANDNNVAVNGNMTASNDNFVVKVKAEAYA